MSRPARQWLALVGVLAATLVLGVLAVVPLLRDDAPAPGTPPNPTTPPTVAPTAPVGAGFDLTHFNVRNRAAAVDRALQDRPQLLGLNEAALLVRRWERDGAPDGYTLTAATAGTRGRQSNALLTAPGVRVLSSATVPLSPAVPGATYAHDRWALVVVLDVPGHGRHVHVQTHLNPGVRHYADDDPRAVAYALSIRNLDTLLTRYDDEPSLTLAGDMNLPATSTRDFAWAPVLARHGLTIESHGIDVVASRGLAPPRIGTIPRGVSDHAAIVARF